MTEKDFRRSPEISVSLTSDLRMVEEDPDTLDDDGDGGRERMGLGGVCGVRTEVPGVE